MEGLLSTGLTLSSLAIERGLNRSSSSSNLRLEQLTKLALSSSTVLHCLIIKLDSCTLSKLDSLKSGQLVRKGSLNTVGISFLEIKVVFRSQEENMFLVRRAS